MNYEKRITPAAQLRPHLVKKYGRENVSCTNDTGTAWGWIRARVHVDRSPECNCIHKNTGSYWGNCTACIVLRDKIRMEVDEIIDNNNVEVYTYTDDMDNERRELLLDICFK